MLIPLADENPTSTRPLVTVTLIVACTALYIWQHLLLSKAEAVVLAYRFGLVPAALTGREFLVPDVVPPALTVLTSMFLHGGLLHLAGNMLFLWIFGNNTEDAMGHARFLLFYLVCGVAAATVQVLLGPDSHVPTVGASGAISGVLGAYMLLFPRARVLLGLPLGFVNLEFGRYPAIWVLAGWIVLQIVVGSIIAARAPGEREGLIVFGAHIGGFIAGCALVTFFKRRDVPLWRRH